MSGIVLDSFRPGLLYGSNLVNIRSPMVGWLGAETDGVWSVDGEMGPRGWQVEVDCRRALDGFHSEMEVLWLPGRVVYQ